MVANLDLPKRPKFFRDVRSVPSTDGKKNQAEYVDAVKSWFSFHDKPSYSNRNKIPIGLHWIMLQSHLYGRAKDLCIDLIFEEIESDDGVEKYGTLYTRKMLSPL